VIYINWTIKMPLEYSAFIIKRILKIEIANTAVAAG
tara:strand:- start:4686 stop:4793 length:108 start_codon:yes stop_codon:yes gene_type:complete